MKIEGDSSKLTSLGKGSLQGLSKITVLHDSFPKSSLKEECKSYQTKYWYGKEHQCLDHTI